MLVRYNNDPFLPFRRLLLDEVGTQFRATNNQPQSTSAFKWDVANLRFDDEVATISAELPGINTDDLDLTIEGRTLTIKANRAVAELEENQSFLRRERWSGSFGRSWKLPYNVDADAVTADYTDGILTVTLPRVEAEKPRKIELS